MEIFSSCLLSEANQYTLECSSQGGRVAKYQVCSAWGKIEGEVEPTTHHHNHHYVAVWSFTREISSPLISRQLTFSRLTNLVLVLAGQPGAKTLRLAVNYQMFRYFINSLVLSVSVSGLFYSSLTINYRLWLLYSFFV